MILKTAVSGKLQYWDSIEYTDGFNLDDLRAVINGTTSSESLCLKCLETPEGPTEAHPFFEGSLCKGCSVSRSSSIFSVSHRYVILMRTGSIVSGTIQTLHVCFRERCKMRKYSRQSTFYNPLSNFFQRSQRLNLLLLVVLLHGLREFRDGNNLRQRGLPEVNASSSRSI